MAKLRKFVAYRSLERPYTRVSKYREKSYIRTTHNSKVVLFDMGNLKKEFPFKITLQVNTNLQIRDNAMESARETANRLMEKIAGIPNYHFKVNVYPFQILRENPLAQGAGADRFSTGMQRAFGKPIGQAIRAKKGDVIFTISTDKNFVATAKDALHRAGTKLPCTCSVKAVEMNSNE